VLRVLNVNGFVGKKISAMVLCLAAMLGVSLVLAAEEDRIRERIKPAGEVCVMGTACAATMAVASTTPGAAKDPATVYQNSCFACHATGANNAPIKGNAEHWTPRLAKGLDVLYQSAVNGFNNGVMPPKGLCMDCTNEELQATVDFMLEGVQ
jgi:cytochrome c5